MKVLGVVFDLKLSWTAHINETVSKLSKVQFGIRCLRKCFDLNELLGLVTSLGMSKLYYGAPVWLSRQLNKVNKRKLPRASTRLILSCLFKSDWSRISFIDLNQLLNKATPMMMADFCQAMCL